MPSPDSTFLTPAAHQKLTEELEHLLTEGRLEISARIAEARSHGDLRENADYDAAKNEQGMMEARILQLQQILNDPTVEEVPDSEEVVIGSVVTVRNPEGVEMEYFLAPPENKVPQYHLISPSSPIGKALLGARPGESVHYKAPDERIFELEVLSVRPYRTSDEEEE